jgi:hypothetical protein
VAEDEDFEPRVPVTNEPVGVAEGKLPEWTALVSKSVVPPTGDRGFESFFLQRESPANLTSSLAPVPARRRSGVPSAGYRPDHRAGVELATIEAHRAAEAADDLERRPR